MIAQLLRTNLCDITVGESTPLVIITGAFIRNSPGDTMVVQLVTIDYTFFYSFLAKISVSFCNVVSLVKVHMIVQVLGVCMATPVLPDWLILSTTKYCCSGMS